MAVLRSLVTTLGLNAAQFRSELARSRQEFTGFGGHLLNGSKAIAGGMQTVIAQVFSLRSALIAIGSGAALAGIKAAYSNLDQTAQLGRNIGIAAEQWHAYAQAAEWAGSNSERLADVVKDLNVRIADAAKTGGGPLADFFKQIGQSAQEWAALSPDEQLRRFTSELQKMSANDARFWLDELNDAAAELFDTLYTRKGELLRFADDIERMGMSLTGGQFAAVRDARLELDRLVAVMGALWQQVKASLAPAVAEGSRLMRQWITDSAEAEGGFAELGKGIALHIIDGVEQASRALQSLMQWVDQAIGKTELMLNDATRMPYLKARADLMAARGEYNKAQRAFSEAASDDRAAAPAFAHLAQTSEALAQAEDRVKSFLGASESSGWDNYFNNLAKLREQVANVATDGKGEAPLPPPSVSAAAGVVAIPDSPKSAKIKKANYSQVDSFRDETAAIGRELANRQALLENSNAALADVDRRWYDARAVQAQEAYGASVIEESTRWQEAQRRLQQQYASAYDAAAGNNELQMQLQMEFYSARELIEQDHQGRLLQIENDRVNKQREYQAQVATELLSFTQQQMSITTSAMQQAGMEHTGVYKALFAMQKAAAVPSIIVSTEEAAAKAMAAFPPPYSLGLSASIRTMGYASAGIVAGQAIAGLFDKGGYIPANQFGIVSELGDEFVNGTLVRGPANVTSRRDSEAILARASGAGQSAGWVMINQYITISGVGDQALSEALLRAAKQGAEEGGKLGYQMVLKDVTTRGQIRRNLNT
ncbi:hypothetical protein ACL00X_07050 [Aeromonas diversa]|uniref:hypothetical protein n=1 Tax=Aeromonas diversa TaxID=502790 RepID=UPI0039A2FC35